MSDKILILGAEGMLGKAFAGQFGERAISVGRELFDITDVNSFPSFLADHSPSVVINAAGLSHGVGDEFFHVNSRCPGAMAQACDDAGCKFVFLSSSRVFAGADLAERYENDTPVPVEDYGRSKHEGEQRVQEAMQARDYYIIRLPMVLGYRSRRADSQIVNKLIAQAQAGQGITVSTNIMHTPVYVGDVANMLDKLLSDEGSQGIYHITGGPRIALDKLVEDVFRELRLDVDIQRVKAEFFEENPLKDLTLATRRLPPVGDAHIAVQKLVEEFGKEGGA